MWNAQNNTLAWSTTTGSTHASFYHVDWSLNGKKITAVFSDGSSSVKTWDAATGHLLWQKEYLHNEPDPSEIAWSPDGKFLAVSTGTQTVLTGWGVSVFNGRTGKLLAFNKKLSGSHGVNSIAWSPDSTMIATTGEKLSLWNVSSGTTSTVAPTIDYHDVVSWSHDGSALVFGSYGVFQVIDVTTTTTHCTATYAPGDSTPMMRIAWSTNDQSVFTASFDLMLIFNVSNCAIQRISPYKAGITPNPVVQWSPNSKWVALSNGKPTVRMYDVTRGTFAEQFEDDIQKTVVNVSWSPNSHLLASIDVGGTVIIWALR
ncbi:hypothetical protein KSC_028810 [Ktedonobacter sp. SOSP1-52]|uniref:WD40 repeat domain-containing protein n=1 Tax=Ktedonobacter sp. SOSP1-52 TaxID=2778366 RepID=UPI001A3484F0|nr:WD40 repeat domain-containing protein [Ktedonobacter sp. SOSP1-52]GHO63989.1 hypothetical protein KSC_028810 [Ktedonobacter sp. SOSP1-52]